MSEPAAELLIDITPDGIGFFIHVTPRARRERIGGLHGDALRVAVRAPPVEGLANEACVRSVARALDVSRRSVTIKPGSKGRRKRVRVQGPARVLADRLRLVATESGVR